LVSVKEDMPRSYLPAFKPGRMLSNGALTTLDLSPITLVSATARSASIPMTVLPFGAVNSFGG
jgi:hypothetical protein